MRSANDWTVWAENMLVRVRPDEAERSWDEIEHQRAGDRAPRTRSAARRNTVTVPEDELRRTIAAITQRRAEESFRGRAARLRSQEETGESDRQGAEKALRTQMPQTQTLVSPKRIAPSLQRQTPAIPQAPTPRKLPQDAHPDGLLTPPPTRPDRTEKRPRLSQSLQAVLQYRESFFRDKEKDSVARSWCDEAHSPSRWRLQSPSTRHSQMKGHCRFCTAAFAAGSSLIPSLRRSDGSGTWLPPCCRPRRRSRSAGNVFRLATTLKLWLSDCEYESLLFA